MSSLTAPSRISPSFLLQPQKVLTALNSEISTRLWVRGTCHYGAVAPGLFLLCGRWIWAASDTMGGTPEADGCEDSSGMNANSKVKPLQITATRQKTPQDAIFLPAHAGKVTLTHISVRPSTWLLLHWMGL